MTIKTGLKNGWTHAGERGATELVAAAGLDLSTLRTAERRDAIAHVMALDGLRRRWQSASFWVRRSAPWSLVWRRPHLRLGDGQRLDFRPHSPSVSWMIADGIAVMLTRLLQIARGLAAAFRAVVALQSTREVLRSLDGDRQPSWSGKPRVCSLASYSLPSRFFSRKFHRLFVLSAPVSWLLGGGRAAARPGFRFTWERWRHRAVGSAGGAGKRSSNASPRCGSPFSFLGDVCARERLCPAGLHRALAALGRGLGARS